MKFEHFLVCAAILFLLSGCATITRGLSEPVNFESNPGGAKVEMEDGEICDQTPCVIDLRRDTKQKATITKDGCESASVNVVNRFSATGSWMLAGNIVVGALGLLTINEFSRGDIINPPVDLILASAIGVGIDLYTGASREIFPNPVKADLECG